MVWRVTSALYLRSRLPRAFSVALTFTRTSVSVGGTTFVRMLMLWISSTFSSDASPELSVRWKLTAYFPKPPVGRCDFVGAVEDFAG